MIHPLQEMMQRRKNGEKCGIPSYCTANELVLEAVMERAKELDKPVLIEATANQVNQFGGYTGMKPEDFMKFVLDLADKVGMDRKLLIPGGDHLGPLTWVSEPESSAMEKAKELVRQFVAAGFTKIHLDTSMKLGDDAADKPLATEVIARRGVELYKVCMEAYEKRLEQVPDALRPVFIIGSEVPIPGGAQEEEEGISVTKPEDFADTVQTYKRSFEENGVADGWKDVIAVVVQPGVEFGDSQVFLYDRGEAAALCKKLDEYPEVVFEGHSTDYQTKECLREMVEDGIAILKVGPALTFGLREALFALDMIEKELIPQEKRADFPAVLEKTMLANPGNWQKHYHGTEEELAFARKYSFSDRCRYYMGEPEVTAAIEKLFEDLSAREIPLTILHQYMPLAYERVIRGELAPEPRALAKAGVAQFMLDYEYAAQM